MSEFRELQDFEIDRLDDARLLAYIDTARRARRPEVALQGVRHLVFRHLDSVRARVRRKLPAHLVDDVTADAMVEAIGSTFAGTTIGEFHKWLSVIVQRHIADFYRGPKGRQLERDKQTGMGQQTGDEGEELPRDEVAEEGGFGRAELDQIIEMVMSRRSEQHQRVIDMLVFGGYSAAEAAAETRVSEANAYQIVHRFRADLRRVLEGGELEGNGDTEPGP